MVDFPHVMRQLGADPFNVNGWEAFDEGPNIPPPPDPAKLLAHWMEWERGETPPGRVMSSLKTGGLREVLEELVARSAGASTPADG